MWVYTAVVMATVAQFLIGGLGTCNICLAPQTEANQLIHRTIKKSLKEYLLGKNVPGTVKTGMNK